MRYLLRMTARVVVLLLPAVVVVLDSTAQDNSMPSINLSVVGINSDNSRASQDFTITVTQTITETTMPLLPYVFFEKGSSKIPSHYDRIENKDYFTEYNLVGQNDTNEPIKQYYQILNIIGYRLLVNPEQTVSLLGSCSVSERSADLARKRATAVQDYLHNVFGIERERIPVVVENGGLLPANERSKSASILSDEEHQRVEFRGPWVITGPVMLYDTLTATDPPSLLFEWSTNHKSIRSGDVDVFVRDVLVKKYRIDSVTKIQKGSWLWSIDEDELAEKELLNEEVLKSVLTVEMVDYSERRSPVRENVIESAVVSSIEADVVSGVRINQFNLILFGFGSDKVLPLHDTTLQRIKSGENIRSDFSRIIVTGYADDIGSEEVNRKVAAQRAENVKASLQKRLSDLFIRNVPIEARGFGKADLTKQNFLSPEARMYSRTVRVMIVTSNVQNQ
jgi:outer membrane protein OmpA-like peptidoglycan-associated protein